MADIPISIGGYIYPTENPRRIQEIQKKPEQQKKDRSNGSASQEQEKDKQKPGTHVDTRA